MNKILSYVLRFGPLVAGAVLAFAALIEHVVPGFTGILNQVLSLAALLGFHVDPTAVSLFGDLVAGVTVLVGVARKISSLWKAA